MLWSHKPLFYGVYNRHFINTASFFYSNNNNHGIWIVAERTSVKENNLQLKNGYSSYRIKLLFGGGRNEVVVCEKEGCLPCERVMKLFLLYTLLMQSDLPKIILCSHFHPTFSHPCKHRSNSFTLDILYITCGTHINCPIRIKNSQLLHLILFMQRPFLCDTLSREYQGGRTDGKKEFAAI